MLIYPVILSGGAGSRLWPLSREHYPKQLLSLVSDFSLLQETLLRLDGMDNAANPLVVCNEEHRFIVAEQIRQLGKTAETIILEPAGRNTAPALTLAALHLLERNQDALMLVMPADHSIEDTAAFLGGVKLGAGLAERGELVTLGILPVRAETGYGYIKKGEKVEGGYKVAAFVEKPDLATAQHYVKCGDYFWNSGIFMMLASTWLKELGHYRSDIAQASRASYQQGGKDGDFYRVDSEAFRLCPSDSIDYAVMEKTKHCSVVPLDAGWSDIGAWPALWEVCAKDDSGNVVRGDIAVHATQNSLLIAQHRFLATVGLENIIVIETADAVLVVHKDQAQGVKEVFSKLKQEQRSEYKTHRKVYRPWGFYEGIDAGERFQVKRITVNPGAVLSLQMHHHRAEHWIVVKGTAKVVRGDEVFLLSENQSTYIPLGMQHRLENPGTMPLEMIEVQSGSYLGEDDIVRFEDVYNRCDQ